MRCWCVIAVIESSIENVSQCFWAKGHGLKGKRLLWFYYEDCQPGLRLIPSLIHDKLEMELKSLVDKPHGAGVPEENIINELSDCQKSNVMIYNLPENNNPHKSDNNKSRIY